MKSNQRDLLCCFLTLDFGGLCAFIRHLSKDNLGLYCSNVTFFFFLMEMLCFGLINVAECFTAFGWPS